MNTCVVVAPLQFGLRDGRRVIELARLNEFIHSTTTHASVCSSVSLVGETRRYGLASTLLFRCSKCSMTFKLATSSTVKNGKSQHYAINVGATLGQISTGGGATHLQEQMASIGVPSLSKKTFTVLERKIGRIIEEEMAEELVKAGAEERRLAIERGDYHEDVPAIPVVVDGGWSKRTYKHSYNANSGVGVIFGATTRKFCMWQYGISTVQCVQSHIEMELSLRSMTASRTGVVRLVRWRQTLSQRVFFTQRQCMVYGTCT